MLHWCLAERDRSTVPVKQEQMGVLIKVAADIPKIGTRTICGADVLAPARCELKTA